MTLLPKEGEHGFIGPLQENTLAPLPQLPPGWHPPLVLPETPTVKTLTQLEYIDTGGLLCPYCQSNDIISKGLETDLGTAYVASVSCKNCNKMWRDVFVLDRYEPID